MKCLIDIIFYDKEKVSYRESLQKILKKLNYCIQDTHLLF